jgi:histidinol-phosphate aminotransferase
MTDFLDSIKKSVRAIEAYHLKERQYRIKLNQNENPHDLPAWLKREILEEAATLNWNRYPHFDNDRLKSALAHYLDVAKERILLGNGSNELLQILTHAVLSEGRRLLIVQPTFTVYQQLARVAGAELIELDFAKDWSFPVDDIVDRIKKTHPHLTILCAPNSPTGADLPEEALEEIVSAASGLVLADEAYHGFSGRDYIPLQKNHRNLIVTRTFSKAMGLAGLRIGYMLADPGLIVQINKGKLPYNLNIFSELVACKLIAHQDLVNSCAREIIGERQRVSRALAALEQVRVFPSASNFLMIETPLPGKVLFEDVYSTGILIRDISGYHPRLTNALRISIGTTSENDALLDVMGSRLK